MKKWEEENEKIAPKNGVKFLKSYFGDFKLFNVYVYSTLYILYLVIYSV